MASVPALAQLLSSAGAVVKEITDPHIINAIVCITLAAIIAFGYWIAIQPRRDPPPTPPVKPGDYPMFPPW